MGPVRLHHPETVEDASKLLSTIGDEASLYCGGTELLQVMKMGLATFEDLIDLKRIDELRGISRTDSGGLRIGAAVTHREIERSTTVAETLPALVDLERQVGNVRVRNAGSLGGNLCFAEPHSDPATLLIAAGAELELATARDRRRLAAGEFVVGPLTTMKESDEVLVAVHIPAMPAGTGLAHRKIAFFERPAATVSVRVAMSDGHIADAAVVVGSVGAAPERIPAAEEVLTGASRAELPSAVRSAAEVASRSCDAFNDHNGSAEYKRELVSMLVVRAATAAGELAV